MPKQKVLTERGQNIVRLATMGSVQDLVDLLNEGTHHGKPGANQAEKILVAKTMLATYRGDDAELTARVRELAAHPSPMAKQVACALMQELWPRQTDLTPLMLQLTMDDDWEVREWAAPAFTCLLSAQWPQHLGLIEELTAHPHESVKRQVALAIKQTAQKKIPESAGQLLELTERLLPDEHEYVRINLGPFCIGDGLLRIYPQETLCKLHAWAGAESWPVRWNAVMSFSGAQGAAHPDDAWAILRLLLDDTHQEVRKAARKTLKNLRKRCPEDQRFAELANV
ncbi:hypothetical protein CBW65_21070 [Tumebacillus avium]|uniref:DNA alkylation repair protein n=1 Tax=Tumebacillus avium TaxID=1903704 RepID=A0A1Y0IT78_9BACL|nr:HEAT repeat domain-containing protein [Tumebacillus avium]ARU63189.1 hypothetical protein CBW65_21070 [Tumebacillus avium]